LREKIHPYSPLSYIKKKKRKKKKKKKLFTHLPGDPKESAYEVVQTT
jgi:hypothetical protein